jgi:formamidopyrimidine-DNA glycosylase
MKAAKYLKAQKKRQAKKLATHLETLGAAFCREYDIPPGDAMLISKRREDGSTEYFFERKIEKVNMSELHPDIQICMEAAFRKAWGPDLTDQELDNLRAILTKYKEGAETVSVTK